MYTKRERRRSTVVGAYNLHHEECSFRFYLTRLTFTRYTFSSFGKHRCFINSKCTIDMFVLRIAFVIFHTRSAQLSLKSTSNFTYGFITVLSSTLEFYFFYRFKVSNEGMRAWFIAITLEHILSNFACSLYFWGLFMCWRTIYFELAHQSEGSVISLAMFSVSWGKFKLVQLQA